MLTGVRRNPDKERGVRSGAGLLVTAIMQGFDCITLKVSRYVVTKAHVLGKSEIADRESICTYGSRPNICDPSIGVTG